MASRLTARDLACFDPDQLLIDDTIQERLEQLGHAQRAIAYDRYITEAKLDGMSAFWHLDMDLEILGKHSFPYFDRNEETA